MKGVDLFDQKAQSYGIVLRSHRWHMEILFHFIEICLINSYIIYPTICKTSNKTFLTRLQYQKEIARQPLRSRLLVKNTTEKSRLAKQKAHFHKVPAA